MPPRDDNHHEPVHLRSEDSTLQHGTSEELENHKAHEKGNLAAYPSDPKLPAKNNKEKMSYAEHENRALAAQVSDLKTNERPQLESERTSWLCDRKMLGANSRRSENENINIKSKNDIPEDEKERLQQEVRQSELQRADLEDYIKKLKDENAMLKEQITGQNRNQTELRENFQQEKQTFNTRLSSSQNQRKILRAENTTLQSKCAELNSANDSLLKTVKDLECKHSQKDEEISRLIDQGSELAEEISGLRFQHMVDDDSTLQERFHSLHYAIRSWCLAIHDAKAPEQSATFSRFPLAATGSATRLFDLADQEVNVLIACTWEWMVKLIFGSTNVETGYNDSPDLWTDKGKASCLHDLELHLHTQGKEEQNRDDLTDD
jgi:hypothetical protein